VAVAHTCGHQTYLVRIGTSSSYYKWWTDTTAPGSTIGHFTWIYNCGSNGCVFSYTHSHIPAGAACPHHVYKP